MRRLLLRLLSLRRYVSSIYMYTTLKRSVKERENSSSIDSTYLFKLSGSEDVIELYLN